MRLLLSFAYYYARHPRQRFWQALRNWSGVLFLVATDEAPTADYERDTFYWRGRSS